MAAPDIGYLLNKATRHLRLGFAASLSEVGLRPQQAAALMALGRSGQGRLTPSQLAEAIDVDAPTASGLLDRLERDGWIASEPNPADGRSRFAVLTRKATDVLPAVIRSAAAVSDAALACFTAEEASELERLLWKLCESDATQLRQGGSE